MVEEPDSSLPPPPEGGQDVLPSPSEPHPLHIILDKARFLAKLQGHLVNNKLESVAPEEFFDRFLSDEFSHQRQELIELATQYFPFTDLGTTRLTPDIATATELKGLTPHGQESSLDPETAVVLNNMLHEALAFVVLEAAISQKHFETAVHFFKTIHAALKQGKLRPAAASAHFDPQVYPGFTQQSLHYWHEFQPPNPHDRNKTLPETLVISIRPGHYPYGLPLNREEQDLSREEEDAELVDIKTYQVIGFTTDAPDRIDDQPLPKTEIQRQAEQAVKFRPPRLTIAWNPNHPNFSRYNPRDTLLLKFGVVNNEFAISFGTEREERRTIYDILKIKYHYHRLRHSQASKDFLNPQLTAYAVVGDHFNQLSQALRRRLKAEPMSHFSGHRQHPDKIIQKEIDAARQKDEQDRQAYEG